MCFRGSPRSVLAVADASQFLPQGSFAFVSPGSVCERSGIGNALSFILQFCLLGDSQSASSLHASSPRIISAW